MNSAPAYLGPMAAPAFIDDETHAASDAALMVGYAAGDAAAFDALYARHKGGIYRYLLRHCGQKGVADELFQDVWMNVIRARATYAPTATFATWIYRIAHNRMIDHWRTTQRAQWVSTDAEDESDALALIAAPANDEPPVRAEMRDLRQRLFAALRTLPAAQRDAFLLQQEGELTLAEIAALTGAGVETVKSRLRYATGRLRHMLGDFA